MFYNDPQMSTDMPVSAYHETKHLIVDAFDAAAKEMANTASFLLVPVPNENGAIRTYNIGALEGYDIALRLIEETGNNSIGMRFSYFAPIASKDRSKVESNVYMSFLERIMQVKMAETLHDDIDPKVLRYGYGINDAIRPNSAVHALVAQSDDLRALLPAVYSVCILNDLILALEGGARLHPNDLIDAARIQYGIEYPNIDYTNLDSVSGVDAATWIDLIRQTALTEMPEEKYYLYHDITPLRLQS